MIPKECKRLAEVEFPIAVVQFHKIQTTVVHWAEQNEGDIQ